MASISADTHDAASVVRDFYESWIRGDADRLVSYWADDAVMETVFSTPPVSPELAPPRMEGGDTVRAFWRGVMGAVVRRDLHDLWVRAVEEPGWVVARFRGDMQTADGRPYRNSYNNLLRVRDGRIVEYYEYSNPLVILGTFVGEVGVRPAAALEAGAAVG